jgi:amino acid permease
MSWVAELDFSPSIMQSTNNEMSSSLSDETRGNAFAFMTSTVEPCIEDGGCCGHLSNDSKSSTEITSKLFDAALDASDLEEHMEADIQRIKSGAESQKCKKLPPFQSSSVLVNYISIGYILLPAGFAIGGTMWTTICLALVSLQSYISGIFVLESCARAEALENLEILTSHSRHGQKGLPRRLSSIVVRERKFELSELCRYFMGRKLRNFFTFTTMGDLYGVTWALSAVFGSALADAIPMTDNDEKDYKFYIFVFMAITVPLSCLPISGQVVVQMLFLTARMAMVVLMIVTTAVAYTSSEPHFGTQVGAERDVPMFNLSRTVSTMVLCIFSTAFQFSVPSLTSESKHKEEMVPVIRSSVSFVYMSNVILGVVLAIFFGSATNKASNLNWVDYHGGTWDGQGNLGEGRAWWATLISQFVVVFAAIDGLAVYPLCAISLGEILMGTVYEERIHEMEGKWKVRTLFRLIASVPQAIGSIFISDLGVM